MSNWLHRFLNPHCPQCLADKLEDVNPVIEELKTELTSLRYDRDRLLKYILEKSIPSPTDANLQTNAPVQDEHEPIRIGNKPMPFAVRRQMLEAEDRAKAARLKEFSKDQEEAINKLEKELKLEIPDNDEGKTDVQSEPIKVNE